MTGDGLNDAPELKKIQIAPVREEAEVRQKEKKLPKKLKVNKPPPTPRLNVNQNQGADSIGITTDQLDIDENLELGDIDLGSAPADNDAVPIVRITPMYPRRAQEQFIEGWVKLRFDITQTGATANVRVVAAKPKRIFDRAAIQAVSKWKYKPKVVDGKSQVQKNQEVRLTFDLD